MWNTETLSTTKGDEEKIVIVSNEECLEWWLIHESILETEVYKRKAY